MVNRFVFNGTDFGVDGEKSYCSVEPGDDDSATIHVKVVGDQAVYDRLTATAHSEWSWTLYPPMFQLSQHARIGPNGVFAYEYDENEDADADGSLYLMEHYFPLRLRVQISPDGAQLDVRGEVDFMGSPAPVEIVWKRGAHQ